MTPERLQQIEELFHSALTLAPPERAAFLAAACGGDEALRVEVESLLKSHTLGETFIERPAADVAAELLAAGRQRLEAGRRLGRYEIKSLLGEGGMGEVYLASDVELGRHVALKLLPAQFTTDAERVRRFEREARAASALNHPNIVTIHEIGRAGPLHFIATEFVDGETLREHAAGAALPLGKALDVAVQVASALAAAHEAGVVHRDVKPENVMLRRDRIVKVLDFGLAKLAPQHASAGAEAPAHSTMKTSPGVIMGTVAYMSPEQARGLEVDARTDVWSLGVVLYEMVAGRQPFEGATPTDIIISVAGREPAPLSRYAPEAPAELERIVSKALAKDRQERYQTAEELLNDLKRLSRGLEIEAEVGRSQRTVEGDGPAALAPRDEQAVTLRLPRRRARPRRTLALAALAVALVVAGLVYALSLRRGPSRAGPQTEITSLAVLPLENLSGDPSEDYFAEGMTEALITDLAKIGALRVTSRPSVMRYKDAGKTLPEIGRELNVDALLTGSVARSGGRVRIAVQLTHAATERNLWADSYERDLRDVLTLQRDVTRDIVGEIRIKLTPQEQGRFGGVRPVNPEAYDHYLRGQFYLHRQNREGNEAAVAALERAVAADPNFAAAHAELAQAYVWKLFLFAPEEERLAEKAYVAAEKALALDPDLAVAYLARGRLLWTPANRFPHEKAIREYKRALSLNPNLDEARNQLALVYNHVGAFDAALGELERALEINPANHLAQFRIGETLLFKGEYEQALAYLRGVPADVNPALVGHQTAWALFNLGRREEAAAAIERFARDYPEDNRGLFTAVQAVLAASAGRGREAEEKIRSAVERGKGFGHFHHTAYHIACAYALMNEPEQAVKWLEAAAEDGFPCYPLFERDANLNNVRRDARFVAFMSKLRRQWETYSVTP
ncbi:MAG TPA: protein kinase [Pyrinomonadaceae bacterium]|nr:protein kinase [Pyrinomonadaceae bacterium]